MTYLVVGVIAFVLAAAVVVLLLQNGSQADDIDELKAEIETLQSPDEDAAADQKKAKGTARDVDLLKRCLPEMQNQLNSLEISGGFAFPTDQLSAECNSLIYPSGQQGE